MTKSCEFVIGLTAFFTDGTKELFTVTHTGSMKNPRATRCGTSSRISVTNSVSNI